MTPEQKDIKKELQTKSISKVDNWLTAEGLALLEGLSRDGYGYKDLADRIGVARSTLLRWADKYQAIDEALRKGREVSDYMVENALFKSALGYRTKEVSIKTKIENGVVTEVIKDVNFRDQNPNMRAIELWLYNRRPDVWKKDGGKRLDELIEDSSIQITVNRGLPKEEENNNWQEEINEDITIDKPTNDAKDNTAKVKLNDNIELSLNNEPKRESNLTKYNNERKLKDKLPSDNIHVDREKSLSDAIDNINHMKNPLHETNEEEQKDLDEWPDNWEDIIKDIGNGNDNNNDSVHKEGV